MLIATLIFLLFCAWVWSVAHFRFSGAPLEPYDRPSGIDQRHSALPSPEHQQLAEDIARGMDNPSKHSRKALQQMREFLDQRGEDYEVHARVVPLEHPTLKGEWVIAPKAHSKRRLLYLHGGAYVMGSAKSHRRITDRLSRAAKAAVLALDYRLMPEYSRMQGVEDCREAYDWLWQNGPKGTETADVLVLAGDSSGGNLVLSTIAWARDKGRRPADAVVALCPQTDATFTSPSLKDNADKDVMQGKQFGPLVRAPRWFSLWLTFAWHKRNPRSPLMSPLRGDLSGLPPTLIHASEADMFMSDALRYANKMRAAGGVVRLEMWSQAVHVWHNFDVPEAQAAFAGIEQFFNAHIEQGIGD